MPNGYQKCDWLLRMSQKIKWLLRTGTPIQALCLGYVHVLLNEFSFVF